MVAKLAAVQVVQGGAAEQLHLVVMLWRTLGAEGFEQFQFQRGTGKQQRAIGLELEAGLMRPVLPDAAAGLGQLEHLAGRLAGDQGLAEVAHRSAQGRGAALEDPHLEPAPGGGVGVGQAEDAGADDE
ncbi:hypothetical protein D3C79_900540 [compost metagenome]